MIQRQYQFAAVEYGMLKVLVECDGIVRTGIDAKLAEYTGAEVVFVFRQYLLFLAVFRFYGFARHLDGVVGTSHLAQAARDAMVLVPLIVGHCQRTPETFGEFQRLPVFRILFGSLLTAENGHSGFHTREQGSDTIDEAAYVGVIIFHQKCNLNTTINTIRIRFTMLIGTRYFHSRFRIWSMRRRGNVHLIHISRNTTKNALPKNHTKPGM